MATGTEFYRRYRPIQLNDLVGQELTVESLQKAARKESFNHAYLLSGQFGSGKTSIARVLASLLTCPSRKPNTDKACGKCKSCKAIHEGNCLDVMEVDGASTRGVDNIRDLKKTAYYSPQELARKVYIIDECHALTADATKALLKILEEPPSYVVFILCTTDPDKVPGPILSRCQRYNFTKIPTNLMADRLLKVSIREGIQLEPDASQAIAKMAKGSMRDALGYLEQISVFSEGKISSAEISKYFGLPERWMVYKIIDMIADINISGMLHQIDSLIAASIKPKAILSELSDVFRNVNIVHWCGDNTDLLDTATNEERQEIVRLAKKLRKTAMGKIANSFSHVDRQISHNINPRLVLEAALINCILTVNTDALQAINDEKAKETAKVAAS